MGFGFGVQGPQVQRRKAKEMSKTKKTHLQVPATVRKKDDEKPLIKPVKILYDVEWYHLVMAAAGFIFIYQVFIFTLWHFFPGDMQFINRYSWSQADATGIFAIIVSIWAYWKAKKEWHSEEGKSMKWLTTKFGMRLKKAVDSGEIPEEKIDEVMDKVVGFIVKASEQDKAYDKIKGFVEYAQKHQTDIENAVEFLKTIPKLSDEDKQKLMELGSKVDKAKVIRGIEKVVDYLSNMKDVTEDDIKKAEKEIEASGIPKDSGDETWLVQK